VELSSAKQVVFLVLAVFLILVVGIFGFIVTFSDLGPGETWMIRITTLVAVLLCGGMGVGLLLNEWWPASAACGWGPFLLGVLALLVNILQGSWTTLPLILLGVLLVPAVCLLGGWLGFRLRKLISRKGPPSGEVAKTI
jgi:hypothetical protein